jgi:hypothetical protein
MEPEPIAVLVQPVTQPGPMSQQRLVGDLDRRLAGCLLHVERQQPGRPVGVDHRRRHGAELGHPGPMAGVFDAPRRA